METYNLNPSIAYRVSDTVSLGAGVNWQHLNAKYKRAAAIVFQPAATVEATLASDAWGRNVGGLFAVSPATNLGVSYRSTVSHDATGDIVTRGVPVPGVDALKTSGTKASLKLPDTAILSATHQLNDKWEFLGDLSWTGWSSIPTLDLMRSSGLENGLVAQSLDTDFRDTWRLAVGGNYRYSHNMKLKFGLAFDQSPVKGASTRMVSLPDNDRTQISTGAQWSLNAGSTLDLGVAYLMIADSAINNNQINLADPSKNRGLVKGNYTSNVWILGAQYSMPF